MSATGRPCAHKSQEGAPCPNLAAEDRSMCQGHLALHARYQKRYRARKQSQRVFVPDFIADPSKLPKTPPGRRT